MPACWAQAVRVLTYHDFPPFIGEHDGGLTSAITSYLNERAQGRYNFAYEVLPRRRLDAMLESAPAQPLLVLWVARDFFSEPERYQWGHVLMNDSLVLLSMPGTHIELERPESLRGMVLGGVLGHRYPALEGAVHAGMLRREDTVGPARNYLKLLRGRIQLTVMSESTEHYLRSTIRETGPGGLSPERLLLTGGDSQRSYFLLHASPELSEFVHSELEGVRIVKAQQPPWRLQLPVR